MTNVARYLLEEPDQRRRRPRKQELKSQAADRKTHLVQQERVGKYTEGEILKLFYDHVAKEEATLVTPQNIRITKMDMNEVDDLEEEVLAKLEDGDAYGAEELLDDAIYKLSGEVTEINKRKAKAQVADTTDQEDQLDDGIDEDEEGTPLPVKAKKHLDALDRNAAMAKATDELDHATDQAMRIAKHIDGSPLRKAAWEATMNQIGSEIDKLGGGGEYSPFNRQVVRYPHGAEQWQQSNRTVQPGSTSQHPDRSQHTVLPAVVSPLPSQFEAKVTEIQTTRGLSRTASQVRARIEYPDLYWAYVRGDAAEPVQAQQTRQRAYNVEKSAPLTYERALSAEIAKGFSERVASQRVCNTYGFMPGGESFAKAEDNYEQLRDVAQDIVDRAGGSRVDALRKARLDRPDLYKRLNA